MWGGGGRREKKKEERKEKRKQKRRGGGEGALPGARGEVTFARFRPARPSASVCPAVSRPRPAPHASAPRGSPAPRPAAPRVRAALRPHPPRLGSPARAAETVNRREPGAYIYRETRVPEAAASAASGRLLRNFFSLAPLCEGVPYLSLYF